MDARKTDFDDSRWAGATVLLSLDVALPFHEMMGLRVMNPTEFQSALRAFIRQYRILFYSGEGEANKPAASSVFSFVQSAAGAPSANAFRWWTANLYCEGPREHLDLQFWTLVIRFARRTDDDWKKLNLPFRVSDEAKLRSTQSTTLDAYNSLWEDLRKHPLSDWDLHLYALKEWDDDVPDVPNGPESIIYPITAAARGYSFWGWLLGQLDDSEIDMLHRSGQQIVDVVEELRFIQNLVSPKHLLLPSL